jgi:hypothetical protein
VILTRNIMAALLLLSVKVLLMFHRSIICSKYGLFHWLSSKIERLPSTKPDDINTRCNLVQVFSWPLRCFHQYNIQWITTDFSTQINYSMNLSS